MSGNPAPRGRRALRADNERLRAELEQQATRLEGLTAQVNVLLGEQQEWRARVVDADRAAAASAVQAQEFVTTQVEAWRKYAQAILRTTNGLQQWTDWYGTALQIRDDELRVAHETISALSSQVEQLWRERSEPTPAAAAADEVVTPTGVEAALREQIADLRVRLDHAAELVDHVVRRLVVPSPPSPGEPSRARLELPLVRDTFSEVGTPIDLIEEYPLLRARPTA